MEFLWFTASCVLASGKNGNFFFVFPLMVRTGGYPRTYTLLITPTLCFSSIRQRSDPDWNQRHYANLQGRVRV
jgi:hypothetical protein